MAEVDLGFTGEFNHSKEVDKECDISLDDETLGVIHEGEEQLKIEVELNFFIKDIVDFSTGEIPLKLFSLYIIIRKLNNTLEEKIKNINCSGQLLKVREQLESYIGELAALKNTHSQEEGDMIEYIKFQLEVTFDYIDSYLKNPHDEIKLYFFGSKPLKSEDIFTLVLGRIYLSLLQSPQHEYISRVKEGLEGIKSNEAAHKSLQLLQDEGFSMSDIYRIMIYINGPDVLVDTGNIRKVLQELNDVFGDGNYNILPNIFLNSGEIIEKIQDPKIVLGFLFLQSQGIRIGGKELTGLSEEKLLDQEYLNQIVMIKNSGIKISYEKFSLEMSHDSTFVDVLMKLHKVGVSIGSIVDELYGEKHSSVGYVENIILLHKSGIKINASTLEILILEKGKSKEYISFIIYLYKSINGIYGDPKDLIKTISISQGKSESYTKNIKILIDGGFNIDFRFFPKFPLEYGENDEYIDNLLMIQKLGNGMSTTDINYYPPEKVLHPKYIPNMEALFQVGVDIFSYEILLLDIFRITNEEYFQLLLDYKKENPGESFIPVSYFVDAAFIDKALENDALMQKAVEFMPDAVLSRFGDLKNSSEGRQYLLEAAKESPFIALEQLHHYEEERSISHLLDEISKVAVESIITMVHESGTIDKYLALKIANTADHLHAYPDLRYAVIDGLEYGEIYDLIHIGREEIFTSTYNGILDRFLAKLKKSGRSLYDIVVIDKDFEGFGIFLEASVSYNRFSDIIGAVENNEQIYKLFQKFIERIIEREELQDAIAMAEILQQTNNTYTLSVIENALIGAYERASDNAKILINMIAKSYSPKTETSWFQDISDDFRLPNLETIKSSELFDEQGRTFQQYFFYNDEDGMGSYSNFLDQYKGGGWKIEDQGSYVYISKSDRNSGKSIHIYANKPQYDGEQKSKGDGIEDIKTTLSELSSPPKSVNIVHRGHSYHVGKTLKHIPDNARTVFLGSCGGYQNFGEVLSRAPDAHIISTKGVGTRHVNDPLFKVINDTLISGSDIVWANIWKDTNKKVSWNDNWENYVRPDLNFGAMFIAKYNELTKNSETLE